MRMLEAPLSDSIHAALARFSPNLSIEEREEFALRYLTFSAPILLNRVLTLTSDVAVLILLARVDRDHLAACGLISALQNLLIRTSMFLLTPLGAKIAALKNSVILESKNEIASFLNASYSTALLNSLALMPILAFSKSILTGFGQAELPSELAQEYFRANLFGLPFILMGISNQQASCSLDYEKSSLLIGFIRRAIFPVLAYALLNGEFGLPKQGIAGLGIANGVTAILEQVLFAANFKLRVEGFEFFTCESFNAANIKRNALILFKSGMNASGEAAIDFGSNLATAAIVGLRGTMQLGAAEVALQIKNFFYLCVLGLAQATTSLCGREPNLIKRKEMVMLSMIMSLSFTLCVGAICLAVSNQLIKAFTDNDDPQSHDLAKKFLILVLTTMIPLHIQKMLSAGYKSFQNFLYPFLVNLFSVGALGIGVGSLLNFTAGVSSVGMFGGAAAGSGVGAALMASLWYRENGLNIQREAVDPAVPDNRTSLINA